MTYMIIDNNHEEDLPTEIIDFRNVESERVFKLSADCTFMATDIVDAMERLSAHFASLARDKNPSSILESGIIEITPLEWHNDR